MISTTNHLRQTYKNRQVINYKQYPINLYGQKYPTNIKQYPTNGIIFTLNGYACVHWPKNGCHFKAGGAIFLRT